MALLVLVVTAGLIGDQAPASNLAPTLVWVIWWVGLAYVSALVGDVWGFLNPWKTVFGWAEGLYRRIDSEGELSFHHRYPPGLGVWPGVLLLAAFAWVELVYVDSAAPLRIAQMAGVYSVLTWGGMLLFGREQWVRHAEVFSLAFGLLARFAPTEVRVTDPAACGDCRTECRDLDGQCIGCCDCYERAPAEARELNLRPFAAGLLRNEAVSPSLMVFILLLLSTVTFDGFTATPLWSDIVILLFDAVPNPTAIGTLGLLVFPVLFIGVYLAVAALMTAAAGRRLPAGDMARAFVFSLVPIALAYHLAHFLSFLLIQGQLIIPLASDPFGFGWNVLGTAGYQVNIGIVDARFAWFTAVAAIVAGHIIAVYLAHVIAIRTLRDRPLALRSQYPMLWPHGGLHYGQACGSWRNPSWRRPRDSDAIGGKRTARLKGGGIVSPPADETGDPSDPAAAHRESGGICGIMGTRTGARPGPRNGHGRRTTWTSKDWLLRPKPC